MSYILTRVFNKDSYGNITDVSVLEWDDTLEEYQASLSLSDTDFIEIVKSNNDTVIDVAIGEIKSIYKWRPIVIDKLGQ